MTKDEIFGLAKKHEREIVFISALVGIIMFAVYMRNKQSGDTGGATATGGIGGATGSGANPTDINSIVGAVNTGFQNLGDQISHIPGTGDTTGSSGNPTGSVVKFNYSSDYGTSLNSGATLTDSYSHADSNGNSSSFGFNIGGLHLGGGLSGSKSKNESHSEDSSFAKTFSVESATSDLFTNASEAQNISENALSKLQKFFIDVGGTAKGNQEHQSLIYGDEANTVKALGGAILDAKATVAKTQVVNGGAPTTLASVTNTKKLGLGYK